MAKKTRKILKTLITCLLCFSFFIGAENSNPTGTLIVTYQTGAKGERLDRIRFWLKGDTREAEMYPQDLNYVDDRDARTVVIENLPLGHYTLHFLVPNKDDFFEETPTRQIALKNSDPVKIDQKIKQKNN